MPHKIGIWIDVEFLHKESYAEVTYFIYNDKSMEIDKIEVNDIDIIDEVTQDELCDIRLKILVEREIVMAGEVGCYADEYL